MNIIGYGVFAGESQEILNSVLATQFFVCHDYEADF